MTDYIVLDVFTDTPFGGNPLAVIPDATGLPEAELQKIAREFNFSETVFLYPPEEPCRYGPLTHLHPDNGDSLRRSPDDRRSHRACPAGPRPRHAPCSWRRPFDSPRHAHRGQL
jgi:hypothetical protein